MNRILNILKKGATIEDNRNAIELCNKHGIVIQGSFMFGNPTETYEEMKTTYQFIKDNYNGFIFKAKDKMSLVNKIEYILANKKILNQCRINAFKSAEKYDITRVLSFLSAEINDWPGYSTPLLLQDR